MYTARGGRSALECVAANEPDIVITDIQMSGMTGTELARIIREEGYGCKIVFLTGYDRFDYARTAIQVGAEDYLLKPFQVDEVESLVTRILEKIRTERRSKETSRLAMGRVIAAACFGKLEDPEATAKAYFQEEKAEARFFVAGFYMLPDGQADQLLALPESLCGFRREDLFISVLPSTAPVDSLVDRLAEKWDPGLRTVRLGDAVSFPELHDACGLLLTYQDRLFFSQAGTRLTADIPAEKPETETPERAPRSGQVLEAIQGGDEEPALESAREYLAALRPFGKRSCIRRTYELCITIRDRLPRDETARAPGQELTDRSCTAAHLRSWRRRWRALSEAPAGSTSGATGII